MKSKLEYFKNNFIKDKDNIHVLDKEDSYVENFGKQWRDYKYVQIDSFNNFPFSVLIIKYTYSGYNSLENSGAIRTTFLFLTKGNQSFRYFFALLEAPCIIKIIFVFVSIESGIEK